MSNDTEEKKPEQPPTPNKPDDCNCFFELFTGLKLLTFLLIGLCLAPLILIPLTDFLSKLSLHGTLPALNFTYFEPPRFVYAGLVSITSLLGFLLLGSEELQNKKEDNGPPIRRALVGTLVIGYFAFLAAILSEKPDANINTLFSGLGQLVTIIVTSYFGVASVGKTVENIYKNNNK
jgi:hypothetical protein